MKPILHKPFIYWSVSGARGLDDLGNLVWFLANAGLLCLLHSVHTNPEAHSASSFFRSKAARVWSCLLTSHTEFHN